MTQKLLFICYFVDKFLIKKKKNNVKKYIFTLFISNSLFKIIINQT